MKLREKFRRKIEEGLSFSPIVALLGPRQIGKTTLAKTLPHDIHYDLDNPVHHDLLNHPEMAFANKNGLIIIDEVQKIPHIFPFLRYWVDNHPEQKFLLLGSASRELVNKSSESLAGRISYISIDGFLISELTKDESHITLWQRGGFPRSFLAPSNETSLKWRHEYIRTFLERDIPELGINLPSTQMRRLWIILANSNGSILNYSEIGRAFELSDVAVRRYVEVLESTLMVRILKPWYGNIAKRQVKKPKVYIRDSGILHALLGIPDIFASQKMGASWESFTIEQVIAHLTLNNPLLSEESFFFWRSTLDEEIDLFFQYNGKNYGIEVKFSSNTKVTKSIHAAKNILCLEKIFIISNNEATLEILPGIHSVSVNNIEYILRNI